MCNTTYIIHCRKSDHASNESEQTVETSSDYFFKVVWWGFWDNCIDTHKWATINLCSRRHSCQHFWKGIRKWKWTKIK